MCEKLNFITYHNHTSIDLYHNVIIMTSKLFVYWLLKLQGKKLSICVRKLITVDVLIAVVSLKLLLKLFK